jgi:CBS domain containing-hemolysin-like protein
VLVSQLAVAREQIPCVGLNRSPAEVWEALRQSPVGFVLVSEQGDLDGASGWLSREDLAMDADAYRSSPPDPRPAVREVCFAADSKPAAELLKQLTLSRAPLAVLVDEFGHVTGLVTRAALEQVAEL